MVECCPITTFPIGFVSRHLGRRKFTLRLATVALASNISRSHTYTHSNHNPGTTVRPPHPQEIIRTCLPPLVETHDDPDAFHLDDDVIRHILAIVGNRFDSPIMSSPCHEDFLFEYRPTAVFKTRAIYRTILPASQSSRRFCIATQKYQYSGYVDSRPSSATAPNQSRIPPNRASYMK